MRKVTKDGRVILSFRHYAEFRREIYFRSEGRCEGRVGSTADMRCPHFFSSPADMEIHHIHGRGGGKRSDISEEVAALCHDCHAKAKILRREPVC